ncbi:hypothetical protein CA831_16905, partial [Burkholderia multivorans]
MNDQGLRASSAMTRVTLVVTRGATTGATIRRRPHDHRLSRLRDARRHPAARRSRAGALPAVPRAA